MTYPTPRRSEMSDSAIQDVESPTANMYGFEPCPKCGGKYRCEFQNKPGIIQCDDCGHNEEVTERRGA
jgi:predicted RNA-binding Zn-ribbon protein involved in translation (DUF1610 family)